MINSNHISPSTAAMKLWKKSFCVAGNIHNSLPKSVWIMARLQAVPVAARAVKLRWLKNSKRWLLSESRSEFFLYNKILIWRQLSSHFSPPNPHLRARQQTNCSELSSEKTQCETWSRLAACEADDGGRRSVAYSNGKLVWWKVQRSSEVWHNNGSSSYYSLKVHRLAGEFDSAVLAPMRLETDVNYKLLIFIHLYRINDNKTLNTASSTSLSNLEKNLEKIPHCMDLQE